MITEHGIGGVVTYNGSAIAVSSFFVYLGLDKEAILFFAVLLLIDYITGLGKALAIKESITSNKMKYGILSKLSLLIIPITVAIAGKSANVDMTYIIYASMNVLVLSEVYSIIANIYSMRTHKELPEFDVTRLLARKIKVILLSWAE
ncbi:phage holin family protein [Halarcobacter anaerophilus]|uniref:Holin n=1 Tax=Halarcobacter anaerophilus TaxID=877500 RepID=A0A4V1LQ67_9BACT|nr:phage holin family protein [Halarcobacter anaerophilus]QDF29003.1 putative membrane protein [Halarcobacter anaerophilus]RXJ63638.1 hypothetical protein CRV06_05440 [Halarcobacter anaerophilus]